MYNVGDKIADKKYKDLSPRNISEDQKRSGPHIVTNHPSGNLVISIGTKVENKSSTSKKHYLNSETEVKQISKCQKTKNTMNTVKTEENRSSSTLKILEEPNLHAVENKSATSKTSE